MKDKNQIYLANGQTQALISYYQRAHDSYILLHWLRWWSSLQLFDQRPEPTEDQGYGLGLP